MERMNRRFFSGLKVLNRSIGNQILDTKELYNVPTRNDIVQNKILSQVKQRNKKYLEQRKQRLRQKLEFSNLDSQPRSDSKVELSTAMEASLTKDTELLAEPSSNLLLLNGLSVLERDVLTKSITERGHYLNSDFSMLSATKGPIRPKLILPELKYGPVNGGSKTHRVETQRKIKFSLPISTKSTAHTSMALSSQRHSVRDRDSSELQINRILPKSLSLPRLSRGEELEKSRPPRSLAVSNKIIQYMMERCKDLVISKKYEDLVSETERAANRRYMIDFYNTNIEMLGVSVSMLELAMKSLRTRSTLEHHVNEFVDAALNSHNLELHLEALKLQAKIHMKFHDYAQAILAFKLIKRVADKNIDTSSGNILSENNVHYFRQKIFADKYISKCLQEIQNYKLAIFYLTKMLQIAWLLKSADDEIYTYDMLGIQHYYLGNLQMSEYYHERMMKGVLEPSNSEIRHVGVQKLLSHIEDRDSRNRKKYKKIKTPEEELHSEERPESEDEFEMPEHHQAVESMKDELKKMKAETISHGKKVVNYVLLKHEQEKRAPKEKKKPFFSQLLEEQKKDADKHWKIVRTELIAQLEAKMHPPKPPVLINHLSLGRKNHAYGAEFLDTPEAPPKNFLFRKNKHDVLPKQVEDNLKENISDLMKNLIIAREKAEKIVESVQTNTNRTRRRNRSLDS